MPSDVPPNPYQPPQYGAFMSPQAAASSGAVSLLWFPLTALSCLLVAGAVAWSLGKLFISGHYHLFVVPGAAGAIVATSVYYAVRLGQCRQRWFGLLLGASCGLITYLGYYQCAMAEQIGPAARHRVDALPRYIVFRIQNDVAFDNRNPNRAPPKPFWPLNLLTFALEFGVVLWLTSVVGFRAASRAFDEAQGRWAEISYATIGYGQSRALVEAHHTGRLEEALRASTAVPLQHNVSHCLLILEQFVPPVSQPADQAGEPSRKAVGDLPPRAFLSVLEIRMPGQVAAINELLYCKRLALRQVELTPAELAAVSKVFPQGK